VEKWKNIRSSEFVEEALEETVDKKKVKTSIFDKANVKPSMKLFLFIALGQIVSMFGTSLTGFALGYWIYKETGSVSYYTLISVCTLLPKYSYLSYCRCSRRPVGSTENYDYIRYFCWRWVLWRLLYYCGAVGLKSGTFIFPQL